MRHFSGEFEGIRLLMADELDLITGGEGEDTDDIQEPPPANLSHTFAFERRENSTWTPTSSGGFRGYPGGGVGALDGPPTDRNLCAGNGQWDPNLGQAPAVPSNWNYHLDWTADKLAATLDWQIRQQSDYQTREYAGFIWADGTGGLHTSNLAIGNGGTVDFTQFTPQQLGFSSWNQVVGIVHNHPNGFGPSAQDMTQLKYFADLAGGPDASQVRTYISTTGGIQEYNYLGANVLSNNSLQEAQNAARRAQQSGNYHPEKGC